MIVKGMSGLIGDDLSLWSYVETLCFDILNGSDYSEVRLPFIEQKRLFSHNLGNGSDIVSKEMYQISYRGKDELVLRPEGTVVYLEMIRNLKLLKRKHKNWYYGAMFRHESVTSTRKRTFYQLGIENLNHDPVTQEIDIISISAKILRCLLPESILRINFIGSKQEQHNYGKALQKILDPYRHQLTATALLALDSNPLRLLDSNEPCVVALKDILPKITDFTSPSQEFCELLSYMQSYNIQYDYDTSLVRGLDYYTGIVFEWTHPRCVSSIGGGGRYDSIVQTNAFGMALGIDRIISLLSNRQVNTLCDYYIAITDKSLYQLSIPLRLSLNGRTHVSVDNCTERSIINKAFVHRCSYLIIIYASDHLVCIKNPSYDCEYKKSFSNIEPLIKLCNSSL